MANTSKKPAPASTSKSGSGGAKKKPASSAAASKALKGAGATSSKGKRPGNGRPRDSKVVAKKPMPWGLIAGAVVVVLFAAAAVGYAIVQVNDKQAEAAANDPTKITGVKNYEYPAAQHSTDNQTYKQTPPVGGVHNPEWADCTGTVYSVQIKNENAVHSLEHGAIWITYDPALDAASVAKLATLVDGQEFMLMSPFPDQGAKISLQSWGHQLKVSSPDDPRIKKFIAGFRHNETYTPEFGATCDNPTFKQTPKTPADSGTPAGTTDAPVGSSASATPAPATQA